MNKKLFIFISIIVLASCSQTKEDFEANIPEASNEVIYNPENKEKMFSEFSSALSAVLYENKAARQALKEQTLKQFDKNYEVLWFDLKVLVSAKNLKAFSKILFPRTADIQDVYMPQYIGKTTK